MSGRARLTVCAAAASLMAACSLLPLATPSGWMFRALLCVILQSCVGAAARRVPLARPLTVLAQALVSLLVLTVMFASHQALGGIIPGPSAFVRFSDLVHDGLNDVSNFAIPAPVTPGIRILLVGGVLVIALAVDAIAVTYNSAAPAGLPLLALYSVAAGLATGGTQWLYFLIAACGYLLLLLAEGRDRLSRWGRVFGGSPAPSGWGGLAGSSSDGSPLAPVRTGRRIGVMALGIALILPAVLPSLSGGLLDTGKNGTGSGTGIGGGSAAVRPDVALQDYLNQPDDSEVLTYRTDAKSTSDMYLRIVALDQFDGTEWKVAKDEKQDVPAELPPPQGQAAGVNYATVNTSVRVDSNYGQGWLPMPYPALKVDVDGDWRYQPNDRMIVGEHGQTTSGITYQVTSMEVQPTAAQLAAAPKPTGQIAEQDTKVPDSLPKIVHDTALQVTRGATNDYQRAVDLQSYFATSGIFQYNTQAQSGTGVNAIARFLQTKQGFCVHFAFTMAAMARTLGIPARVAVGFTPGTESQNGMMSVGFKDAHAWPELYFEGIGWTRFEPTPYRGSPPSYTQSTAPSGTDSPRDTGPQGNGATVAPKPTPSSDCPAQSHDPSVCSSNAAVASGGSGGGGFGSGRVALIVLLAALILLVPLVPLLWRTRVRAARLGGGRSRLGGPPLAISAWHEVLDTGWDYGIPPDGSETPRRAMARLVQDGGLSGPAASSATALATAVEQTLYAPRPQPVQGLAAEVRQVRTGLHDSANRRGRLRATLLPRSSARVMWQLSARWSALATRLTAVTQRLTPDSLRRRWSRQGS
jgi:transglutaminase-like putative cysteine protease